MISPKIIFEDKYLLVIDKPAGLVVNRAQTTKGSTLQDWLEVYLKLADSGIGERAGIVHRLDKDTSGILLVAKTETAFSQLQQQFKERVVLKKYLALVHGEVKPSSGTIRAAISRSPFNRKKFGVFLGGREAETNYRVIKNIGKFSLLRLEPKTGRTHQLRVHLKHIGHPIVGDIIYAGQKTSRQDFRWCPRLFLHACSICFIHPQAREKITLTSPLPQELASALTNQL